LVGSRVMFAVFKAGGHQYRAKAGDVITIDQLEGKVGDTVKFENVLMVTNGDKTNVGAPSLKGASVVAKITEQSRAPKILILKYKRRKNHKKMMGHRQNQTVVEISKINV